MCVCVCLWAMCLIQIYSILFYGRYNVALGYNRVCCPEVFFLSKFGTHENERTVLYRTKSLDGTKLNTEPKINPKNNPNPNTNPNPNPKLPQILTVFSCFVHFSSTVPRSSVLPQDSSTAY